MDRILVFGALGIVLILVLVLPSWWGTKKAINKVLQTFRKHNAISANNAKSREELELTQRTIMERLKSNRDFTASALRMIIRNRDYQEDALKFLIKADIVQEIGDGRVYLAEERLRLSRFYKPERDDVKINKPEA